MRISDWSSDVCSSDLNSAKEWATQYNTPAVAADILHKVRILDESSGGMQAFYMTSRRELFKDRRVRRALAFAFDFQWTNKTVYYGQSAQQIGQASGRVKRVKDE